MQLQIHSSLTPNQLIPVYVTNRDQFLQAGGKAYLDERQALRGDYCASRVSKAALHKWVDSLPSHAAKTELKNRFAEWDRKIERGIILKGDRGALSEAEFINRVDAFYRKHQKLMESDSFRTWNHSRTKLREALLPEMKNGSIEEIVRRYEIKDPELIARMQNEWSWKKESNDVGILNAFKRRLFG